MKILDLIYPPRCPFCGELSKGGAVCEDCLEELTHMARECPICGHPRRLCTCRKIGGDGGLTAPFVYRGPVQKAVLGFKHSGDIGRAGVFAGYMADELAGQLAADLVTAVPPTPKGFKKRGFDPAGLIAEELAKELGLPYVRLLGSKDGMSQKAVEKGEARIMNVRDRFFTLPGAAIEGKRILLIDDVRTTGATLAACREALLLAGADTVQTAAFAAD
ncbi:MAG TPA: ComF family protein [Candidatus Acidoferrum sp.]|nr:ComF family protein [Candidatus Acidoferrum sp.]